MARSPRAAGAIGSDDYTGFSLILICVGLGILGWASWKLWHAQMVAHWEMQVTAVFSERFSQADIGVQRANPAAVQFKDLVRLYRNIGTEFLYPAMALVLRLARSASCEPETPGSLGPSISTD
jgi:intracellular multiplication protein IcmP